MPAPESTTVVTYLFTDVEGSTRLWESEPERIGPALAHLDQVSRQTVESHRGWVVKMTGDGMHAAFADPTDAMQAAIELQAALAESAGTGDLPLPVRCGLHVGEDERRDNDFFGRDVNRAARIMDAAHGGQILVSMALAERVRQSLPPAVSLRDLGMVRLRDLAGPDRLFQITHPRLRTEFPALRSLASSPNNLSQQLNSFVGREREIREIRALLSANRLVTLLAMGGIGKSRLSVQLAAEVLDEYADGVWLVELAPLSDPQEVAQTVATVLGVKEEVGRPVSDALVRFVRDRQLLLIFDNCEHLIRACADLAKQLLKAGARVKILATSRDVLQVAGETVYHLPTLSVPDLRDSAFPDALTQHEAVRLFVDRAVATQPAFRLTAKNARAIVDICRRLDGIPLAIELAAARTRALSAEAIASRLSERFRLLVTSDETVLPRQRALRALIDWSYDLLNARERALFERLSVFASGWTLEAAEAVGGGDDIHAIEVIDLQSSLVEKSLVVMEADSGRYRMLDTVQQYAQERAEESGEGPAARTRHLSHLVDFVEAVRAHLGGPDQGSWLAILDTERENILAANAWCDNASDGASLGLRLAAATRAYWLSRSLLSLGLRVTTQALSRSGARDDRRRRGLLDAGQLCYSMGRYAEAQTYLEESLEIAREGGEPSRQLPVLQALGMTLLGRGDLEAARSSLHEAAALAQTLGKPTQRAAALSALAQFHRLERKFDLARDLGQQVLAMYREAGDQNSIALGLLNGAMVAIELGELGEARLMVLEAADIAQAIGSSQAAQSVLEVCTGLAAAAEEAERGAEFLGNAEAQARRSGLDRDPADRAFLDAYVERLREQLGGDRAAQCEARGAELALDTALAAARRWLANGA